MRIYIFKSSTPKLYGFTPDQTGFNLPADGGPWTLLKTSDANPNDGPRIGISSQAILEGVRQQGYHLGLFEVRTTIEERRRKT